MSAISKNFFSLNNHCTCFIKKSDGFKAQVIRISQTMTQVQMEYYMLIQYQLRFHTF